MYDSLREETGPLDTDDELEKDEILAENQMLKYLIAIMETEAYPTEEDFSRQFNMLENDVNKNAGCLIGYYGRYRFA
jgi:hypothetical protein